MIYLKRPSITVLTVAIKHLITRGLLLGLCLMANKQILAQSSNVLVTTPAIVSFTADMATISMQDVEAGTKKATLSWQVVELDANSQLDLQVYSLGKWASLLSNGEKLPAQGTRQQPVTSTLGFQPPTYRLVILDSTGTIVDQWSVSIAFAPSTTPPTLTFKAASPSVDINDLVQHKPTTQVSWTVTDRPPTANLVFEQVMDDGTAVSIEQPRLAVWIASTGTGSVLLRQPATNSQTVKLRARLVD